MTALSKGYYRLSKNDSISQPYHWVLVAPNHEVVLKSENYSSKQMALKGMASVRVNCPYDENYDRLTARDGSPYFNLKARNGEIIGTSQMYSTEQAREIGVEAVKKYGRDAEMHDETGEANNGTTVGEPKPITTPPRPWISC